MDEERDDRQVENDRVKSIPPELAESMRRRRPGYDRVYELRQAYSKLPPDERAQISEVDLSESYIVPLFQALGWSVEEYFAAIDGSQPVDLDLEYRGIQVPVEVKKLRDPVSIQPVVLREWRGGRTWAILTDFERAQIWDLESESLIVETSPMFYLANETEEHDLLAAAAFYDRLARPREVERLSRDLSDKNPSIRQEAAEALGDIGGTRAVESLVATLSDPNASVRHTAVMALGKVSDSNAVEPLIGALNDSNESIRQAAVESLGIIGGSDSIETLIAVLSDPNDRIRLAAIQALGMIGDPRAVGPLIAVLSDPNGSIRLAVVQALGQIGDSHAAEALTDVRNNDENASVRQGATDALERINVPPGEPVPDTDQEITIAVRALSDAPSEVDLLGFSVYAEALADFIRNKNPEKPLTIGIDAAWGMGKTTLMHMVKRRLERKLGGDGNERSFTTVWFNAWKYDQEESLWAALALEILAQIQKDYDWRQRARLWRKLNYQRLDRSLLLHGLVKSLVYVAAIFLLGAAVYGIVAIWLGIEAFWQYIGTAGILSLIAAIYTTGKEAFARIAAPFDLNLSKYVRRPDYREKVGFLSEFEEDFKKVIDVVTEGGEWPLVVFIDDLDRCAPPKPAEIIEAINILLDAEHCAFIIGMDSQAVAASIETKYEDLCQYLDDRDDPGGLTLGQRFLEKIVQISFHIPSADPNKIESFVDANLGVLARPAPDEPLQREVAEAERLIKAEQGAGLTLDEAVQAVEAARPDLRAEAVTEARREVVAQTFDDSVAVRDAIRMAAPYLGYNPRKVKRFINIFRLEAFVANRRGLLESQAVQLSSLAKWVIITLRWPAVIAALKIDGEFVNGLLEAHEMQGELRRIPINTETLEERERLEAELESRLVADPRLSRLVDAGDLIKLLQHMSPHDMAMFPYYLYLAQPTSEPPRANQSSEGQPDAQ